VGGNQLIYRGQGGCPTSIQRMNCGGWLELQATFG
jgi:hypothetical protein